MKESNIIGERVSVNSLSKRMWSYKFGIISENGKYYAIKIGDTIYDHLNSAGINMKSGYMI